MNILHQAFRLYVASDRLEDTVIFYEKLQGKSCERRLSFSEVGIEVAVVGGFIVLAGSDQAFAPIRDVQALLIVDSLDEAVVDLQGRGTVILHGPHGAPGGRNFTARHPDGLVVEYYQPTPTT